MDTIENRIQRLEKSRYKMIGRINALQTIALSGWTKTILETQSDPVGYAEAIRKQWLSTADQPQRSFHGADPAEIDLISQEYLDALDDLTGQIVSFVRSRAPKAGQE